MLRPDDSVLMQTVPVSVTTSLTATQCSERVSFAVEHCGLQIKSVGTLATHPGSLHWHIVMPRAKGTLELTYAPQSGECWFAVHANRRADWIDRLLPDLVRHLQIEFKDKNSEISSEREACSDTVPLARSRAAKI